MTNDPYMTPMLWLRMDGFGVHQGGERFVAFGRQEQARQLLSDGRTLIALSAERVNVLDVGFERLRGGCHRQSAAHLHPPAPVLACSQA